MLKNKNEVKKYFKVKEREVNLKVKQKRGEKNKSSK